MNYHSEGAFLFSHFLGIKFPSYFLTAIQLALIGAVGITSFAKNYSVQDNSTAPIHHARLCEMENIPCLIEWLASLINKFGASPWASEAVIGTFLERC